MTTPAFDDLIKTAHVYSFPSSRESHIAKFDIDTASKELRVYFSSREAALSFCTSHGFVADFFWLKFVTFEGDEIAKIKTLLKPFFMNDTVRNQFDLITNKLIGSAQK